MRWIPCTIKVGRSGALVRRGSAYNRDLRTRAFLADFRCLAEVSSRSLPSVLLPRDRSQLGLVLHAVDISRLRFQYHSYPYVLRDYLFLCDVLLSLLDVRCVLSHKAFDAFCENFIFLKKYTLFCPIRVIQCMRDVVERLGYTLDMDLFAFIHTHDPTKVKVVEWERVEDKPRLLDSTIGRTVSLLPVAPARAERKTDAIVESVEVAVPVQPGHQGKRKSVAVDAGGASHPPKKMRDDHGTPGGTSIGAIPTLPFVTAFVSSTSEHSSHHSGPAIAEAKIDSLVRSYVPFMTAVTTVTLTVDLVVVAKEKTVKPSLFIPVTISHNRLNQ
ncbi:hypothetical protein Tco_1200916 [Tanacetum coccineum]